MIAMAPPKSASTTRPVSSWRREILAALGRRLLQLADDAELRDRLGRRGRAFVRENFSVETMVEKIYTLYMRLAQEHGLPR